jgi:hypothetical protein
MRKIRVTFNSGKQYVYFHIGEPLKAFKQAHKCDAWYSNQVQRNRYKGLFGNIYLPKCKYSDPYLHELVTHEVTHLLADWMKARNMRVTDRNEERIATMTGEIVGRFWQKL